MNIYEKIQSVKDKLLKENIKKSGKNKFAGYEYYELADFTPYIIKYCNEAKLFTAISFDKDLAKLTIVNTEEPSEKVEYTSPIEELELKGCNKVQALGGTETYSRRYLYMTAFDIIENDMFDATIADHVIDNIKVQALIQAITNNNISQDKVREVLLNNGYKTISDVTESNYMKVVNEIKALKEA